MTNNGPSESRMLEQVRQWRRESYEADQRGSEAERRKRLRDLANRCELEIETRERRSPSRKGKA